MKARIRKKKIPIKTISIKEEDVEKPTEANICVMCRCHNECTNCKDEQASLSSFATPSLCSLSSILLSEPFPISNTNLLRSTSTTILSSSSSISSHARTKKEIHQQHFQDQHHNRHPPHHLQRPQKVTPSNNVKKYSNLSDVNSSNFFKKIMFRTSFATTNCCSEENVKKSDYKRNNVFNWFKQKILNLFVIFIILNLLTTLFISSIPIARVNAAGEVRLKNQGGVGE